MLTRLKSEVTSAKKSMSVLRCSCSNCENIMCDRYSLEFGYICDYVLDKEFRKILASDFPPIIRSLVEEDARRGLLGGEAFFGLFLTSLIASFFWGIILPIALFCYFFIYSLRFLRFIVRLSRGLKQVSSVAHSHQNNEIVKEKINEIKF